MKNAGFGLVEAVVAVSILAGFVVLLSTINLVYIKISLNQSSNIEAGFLAEEGIEAMRFSRDSGWTTNIAPLANTTNYYLAFNGTWWQPTTTPQLIGIFDRRVQVDQVFRDGGDNITSSGGTLDPNTKLVTSSVSWLDHAATSTKTVTAYITNLFSN